MAGQQSQQSTPPQAQEPHDGEERIPLPQLEERSFALFGVEPYVVAGAAAQKPGRVNFTEGEMKSLVSEFKKRKV
jgi:hypothetical protein